MHLIRAALSGNGLWSGTQQPLVAISPPGLYQGFAKALPKTLPATLLQFAVDRLQINIVMGKSHEAVEEEIGDFSSDRVSIVIFTGHHNFGTFFSNLFEDFVISSVKQLPGIGAF
jgi:hypothetical protein